MTATLTPAGADWRRGLSVVRWGRRAALVLWLGALIYAVFASDSACTPDDPTICGSGPGEAVVIGLVLAIPILLFALPVAGYTAAIAAGALDLALDHSPQARLAWSAYAVLCAALLAHLLAVRGRQRAALPTRRARIEQPPTPWAARAVLAAVLLAAAIGCLLGHHVQANQLDQHLQRAQHVTATMLGAEPDGTSVTLAVAGLPPQSVQVIDASTYHVGQPIPVLVDVSADPPWVRLVAEPEDLTWWQSLAFIAVLYAGLALLRPARERLVTGIPAAGDAVLMVMSASRHHGALLSLPGDPTPLARIDLPLPVQDEVTRLMWRGDHPAMPPHCLVLVTGERWIGGRVTLAADDGATVAQGVLRLPRSRWPRLRIGSRRRGPESTPAALGGDLVTRTLDLRDVALPVTLLPPRSLRIQGAAMLAAAVAILAAAPLAAHSDLVGTAIVTVAITGWLLWLKGITLLTARLVIDHTGFRLGLAVREYSVGWRALFGVRESSGALTLAFGSGAVLGPIKVESQIDTAALMESLRQRAYAVGGSDEPPRARLRPGIVPVMAYWVAALGILWWSFVR